MTTASTTLLGLALPVTGELSGTWGDVVNASLTNLLDTAIAGTTTLSSDADVTLTTTTLSANQARQAVILWTAGGTVTRTITAPAQSKSYVVINATSSSQSIKLVGAGPTTGITIVAGEKCFAAWNGTDFVKVGNTSGAGVFSTVTASSLTSGRVTYAGTAGLLQDSANLTFNGTTLTANTIGAFTLSGTVAGGGNQLNNVIIGTTTPLAGAFTTLSSTLGANFTTSSGVVMIGATPSAWGSGYKVLQVGNAGFMNSGSSSWFYNNSYFNGTDNIYTTTGTATRYVQQSAEHQWYYAASGTAGNPVSFTQNMTLSSTGLAVTGTLSATGQVTASGATNGFVTDATNGYALFSGDPANYNISRNSLDIQIKSASTIGALISGTRILSVSSTGLAVTGTLSATGRTTINSPVNTDGRLAVRQNSDANQYFGLIVESNAVPNFLALGYNGTNWCVSPSFSGAGAYKDVAIFSNNAKVAEFLSTGLAVTGTLGVSSAVTATAYRTALGVTASTADNTPVTLATLSENGLYMFWAAVTAGNAVNNAASAVVNVNNGTARITADNGGAQTITLSGLSVRGTQTTGTTQVIDWGYSRLR